MRSSGERIAKRLEGWNAFGVRLVHRGSRPETGSMQYERAARFRKSECVDEAPLRRAE